MTRLATAWAGVALLVVATGPVARAQSAAAAVRPAGPGAEVLDARCVSCHEADVIVSQRLSQGGWEREIAKMERWGAKPSSEERVALLAYLTREFGPRVQPAHDPTAAAGEATFRSACLACHGDELSTQQRLTSAGWSREVDKMVRWGAKVGVDEKGPLVAFLTSRWGPR